MRKFVRNLMCELFGIHEYGNWSPTFSNSVRDLYILELQSMKQWRRCKHCGKIVYRNAE